MASFPYWEAAAFGLSISALVGVAVGRDLGLSDLCCERRFPLRRPHASSKRHVFTPIACRHCSMNAAMNFPRRDQYKLVRKRCFE